MTTPKDWRPRYIQVADELRAQITKGILKPGDALPSEPELAAKYHLSRTSVRNAIKLLRSWGLLTVQHGKGTFVRQPPKRVQRDAAKRYQWEKNRVFHQEPDRLLTGATEEDTGLPFEQLAFSATYDTTTANENLARIFNVKPGTKLLRRRYDTRDKEDDSSIRTATSYLIYDMVKNNPKLLDDKNEPWPGGTHHQLYTIDIEIDRIEDEVTARLPSPEEADAMQIDEGTVVLCIRKTSIDTADRVVEVANVVMSADRTSLIYRTQLERWKS